MPVARIAAVAATGRPLCAARGALSAELVETAGAARGARASRPRAGPHRNDARGRFAARSHLPPGRAGRRPRRRRSRLLVTGLTVVGVLAVAVQAHAEGRLDRVLIATLALLSLAAFEAVQPLAAVVPRAAGDRRGRPTRPRPHRPRTAHRRPRAARSPARCAASPSSSTTSTPATRADERPALDCFEPPPRAGPAGRPARPERSRQDDVVRPAPALHRPGARARHPRRRATCAATARRTCAA